jgi:hypothetical protein
MKMKYQKPIILDLNARAASGQVPLMCINGGSAGGPLENCAYGVAAGACSPGNGGNYGDPCMSGNTPNYGNEGCISGGSAEECGAGSSVNFNFGCNVGPSIT